MNINPANLAGKARRIHEMDCKCLESSTAPIPLLPSNAVLTLLAEGAANILYKISIPEGTPVKYQPTVPQIAKDFSERNPFEGMLPCLHLIYETHTSQANFFA